MPRSQTRRQFLHHAGGAAALLGLGERALLGHLRPVTAAEAGLDPVRVQFSPDIEPLVRFLEQTPRELLLERVAARIRDGLTYSEVLTALLLAGVRNIQPRPVGFKFHAVLVVNSAHLASLAAPDSDRWLPIFWALDYFKSSQARDVDEGDWTMSAMDETAIPPASKARQSFIDAMDRWDEAGADRAVVGLVRTASAHEIFDLFCRYGARDFRDIGHKAIYVANSWRTLECIGWRHAEPVLRSLAYALLDRGRDPNPAQHDLPADRPGRRNLELVSQIRPDWAGGMRGGACTDDLLETVRDASAFEAGEKVVSLLDEGVAPVSIWDAVFNGAAELLMRNPGIISLHAVTCTNALHFAWHRCGQDETRRFLLLQAASFLPLFRRSGSDVRIDQLEPVPLNAAGPGAIEEIFDEISTDRFTAARKVLAWLEANPRPKPLIDTARRLIFAKGDNSHDYKFSSAVLEDYAHLSPVWRDRFLAASVFNLRGTGHPDNILVQRIRDALAG